MPRFQKWVVGATADEPADVVARRVVAERLAAVSHFLNKAIGSGDEKEAIHQLRVWTRRADAALALFESVIASGRRKRMHKALRKLRRRAGAVRDCDVQLARLTGDEAAPGRVIRRLKNNRQRARQALRALRRRLRKDDRMEDEIGQLLEKITWPKRHSSREAPRFAALGRQAVATQAVTLLRLADGDLRHDLALHELRIAAKELRYTLELTPSIFPSKTVRRLHAGLSGLQNRLGEVRDQAALCEQIGRWVTKAKNQRQERKIAPLLRREERQLAKLRAALGRWWTAARRRRMKQDWKRALATK